MDHFYTPQEAEDEKASTIATTLTSEPVKHDGTHGSVVKKAIPPPCSVNNRKSPWEY